MAAAVIQHLLQQRPAGWFSDYDRVLLQAFADAMEEGQRMQGKDPKSWKWGRYMFLGIENPVLARVPVVGKYFNVGPVLMSGGSTSVKQTTRVLGPSERMDTSVGDWDASLGDLPIGESGHIASSHYRDQWNAYYNGESFPMRFAKPDVKSTVMFVPGR
jgi:penicillin amidase